MSEGIVVVEVNGHDEPDLALDQPLKTYATLTVRLAKELEAIGRQLTNATSRIHAVNAELVQLRGQLKRRGENGL